MATKLIEAISRILTDCPYVISLRDLMTKTRLELENDYFLDLYFLVPKQILGTRVQIALPPLEPV
jgi:hypothetical protein